MDPALTVLLEIQDLLTKARELEAGTDLDELERSHFHLDPETAAKLVREKVRELEDSLPPQVGQRYTRIRGHLDRVVVPVLNGTCYGCFVSVATATAGEADPNASLQTCEHCGRFLYFVS